MLQEAPGESRRTARAVNPPGETMTAARGGSKGSTQGAVVRDRAAPGPVPRRSRSAVPRQYGQPGPNALCSGAQFTGCASLVVGVIAVLADV